MSPPRVVYKEEGGKRLEPLEEVICEVDDEQMGSVIEVHQHKDHMRTGHSTVANTYGQICLMPWPDLWNIGMAHTRRSFQCIGALLD